MNAFVEGSFAYSLLLGMLAAVNPCGFVLLPTYLIAYLSVTDDATVGVRLRRSIVVGTSVASGFLVVFVRRFLFHRVKMSLSWVRMPPRLSSRVSQTPIVTIRNFPLFCLSTPTLSSLFRLT